MTTIVIEGRLPGENEIIALNHRFRSHSGKRFYPYYEEKGRIENLIRFAVLATRGALRPTSYPVRVVFHWHEEDARRDPDNVSAAQKFILDGLVRSQVLPGDGRKYISSLHHFFHTDKVRPRVEVTIESSVPH
jgi:hypothetical protein